jgi:uncharacterized BrkB/YihY/UPF0761 family membrane protein
MRKIKSYALKPFIIYLAILIVLFFFSILIPNFAKEENIKKVLYSQNINFFSLYNLVFGFFIMLVFFILLYLGFVLIFCVVNNQEFNNLNHLGFQPKVFQTK